MASWSWDGSNKSTRSISNRKYHFLFIQDYIAIIKKYSGYELDHDENSSQYGVQTKMDRLTVLECQG